jgi:hypothetical protein
MKGAVFCIIALAIFMPVLTWAWSWGIRVECPEHGVAVHCNDIEHINGITSWQDCGGYFLSILILLSDCFATFRVFITNKKKKKKKKKFKKNIKKKF